MSPPIYHLAAEALGTAPAETLVFEDSLYALKTAKAAGYRTVGVFDAHGETDQAGLQAAAEVYLTSLTGVSRPLGPSSTTESGTSGRLPCVQAVHWGHHLVSPYKTVL